MRRPIPYRWPMVSAAIAGLVLAGAQACIVAAAGDGAAAGIHVTSRGVEASLEPGVDHVTRAVQATFRDLGIRQTAESSKQSGAEREFKGEVDDLEVTVTLRSREGRTDVEVVARRSVASWDKDYAREVLGRIIQRTG
ncbi:MAG: hypothetical protein OER21_12100 [Gemmatimonadota bacterium]|nr:hypothetical protein [Gemmatimonadota bacterium]